jgi:uncharacterized protein (TIGR00369 family)
VSRRRWSSFTSLNANRSGVLPPLLKRQLGQAFGSNCRVCPVRSPVRLKGRHVTTHEERVRQSFLKQAFMSTLGAELITVGQGGVEIRLPFSSNLTQQNGYLHAGAITAVLDSACGYAALTVAADDKEVLTVEFKVNFLAPAAGEVFVARAQVKRAGQTLTVCTADAFAISGGREKVVATMLATIIAAPIPPAK